MNSRILSRVSPGGSGRMVKSRLAIGIECSIESLIELSGLLVLSLVAALIVSLAPRLF